MNAGNQGPTLLKLMQDRGATRRSWVEATVEDLSTLSGMDTHDVKKVLHQMDRMGLVKFRLKQNGKATNVSAIRLTANGMRFRYPDARTNGEVEMPTDTAEPVATIGVEQVHLTAGQRAARTRTEKLANRMTMTAELEGLTKGTDAFDARVAELLHDHYSFHAKRSAATRVGLARESQSEVRPVEAVEPAYVVLHPDNYPLLRDLLSREDRFITAAASIEGDAPDLAAAILEKAQNAYTPVEREMVALLHKVWPRG